MGNKTDFVLLCFGDHESDALNSFKENTGMDFKLMSDPDKAGGNQLLTVDAYGCSYKNFSESTEMVLKEFHAAKWICPDSVCLYVDCDDESFIGCVSPKSAMSVLGHYSEKPNNA